MSEIVVTGANGFVGRALCRLLVQSGHRATGLVGQAGGWVSGVREWVDSTPDFSGIDANWPADLKPDGVVHLAACVHMLNDDAADPEAVFQSTNVEGALRVARAAVRHGARRFVFVGSLLFLAMGGSRAHYRASKEFYLYGGLVGQGKPVVMLGAGNAGASLARELSRSSEWRLVAG